MIPAALLPEDWPNVSVMWPRAPEALIAFRGASRFPRGARLRLKFPQHGRCMSRPQAGLLPSVPEKKKKAESSETECGS